MDAPEGFNLVDLLAEIGAKQLLIQRQQVRIFQLETRVAELEPGPMPAPAHLHPEPDGPPIGGQDG